MPFYKKTSTYKPKKNKGGVRRSQIITTYGVGSVVAVGDESFMIAGIDRWHSAEVELHEPRLEQQLRVRGFALPPAGEDTNDIPVVRFPYVYYCPTCRRLERVMNLR